MKKRLSILFFTILIINISFVLSGSCNLDISLLNQDPYPAIPGDYAKIVFQIKGLENPDCGKIEFELLEKYPISLDISENAKIFIESGGYNKDYSSFSLAPYKIRIDADALDGDNPIEIQYKLGGGGTAYFTKQFNLNIKDTKADFEVHVKDYESKTRTITFEILNIGKEDIEALTVEIPQQENIEIKGPKTKIVGDLDSNEYTTADFEAIISEGEITLNLIYTDTINERRTIEKKVLFEPEYFEGRISDQSKPKTTQYIIWTLLIVGLVYYFLRRRKKKLQKKHKH